MLIRYNDAGLFYENAEARAELITVTCECGSAKLYVNFIPAQFSGCYLKLACVDCGASQVIYDDYS
jgi:hypothetical protein